MICLYRAYPLKVKTFRGFFINNITNCFQRTLEEANKKAALEAQHTQSRLQTTNPVETLEQQKQLEQDEASEQSGN
jgi:peptidyl-tRNA hydrolase